MSTDLVSTDLPRSLILSVRACDNYVMGVVLNMVCGNACILVSNTPFGGHTIRCSIMPSTMHETYSGQIICACASRNTDCQ